MLDVFFTVDVEIWCDGWVNIDEKFPDAYRKYILGPTAKGHYGLPYQLQVLKDHGMLVTFFVEPLFSTRFGSQPLEEIVGLIRAGGQEVQLHLHTEWVDESLEPLIADISKKRQHLFHYSMEEQVRLIEAGAALLRKAGATEINAFRAGSFGFNIHTLHALAANAIDFDSSYNATMFGPASGVAPNVLVVEPIECEGVFEYPLTVFKDGMGSLRHVQLTACSYGEMERLLWQALEERRSSFVILSHNFELLSPSKTRPDEIVVERFRKLCSFLEHNRDSFRTCGFRGLSPRTVSRQPLPLTMTFGRTAIRMLEQAYRRKYL
jgi:hypothetical protein